MSLHDTLFMRHDNCVDTTFALIKRMRVPVTFTSLQKDLREHPDYPSMLSIVDVLNNYGVSTLAINASVKMLPDLPSHFITQLRTTSNNSDMQFTLVEKMEDGFKYYDTNERKWCFIIADSFIEKWSGIVMLTEKNEGVGEKEYSKKRFAEKKRNFSIDIAVLFFPIITLLICISSFVLNGGSPLFPVLFLLATFLGLSSGLLILWHEHDQYSPIVQNICSSGKKINCNAVLQSSGSKIFDISWSSIGVVYFSGTLLALATGGVMNGAMHWILFWPSLFALPYIFYSIYYQLKVVRQWCVLCLFTQGTLLAQFILALAGHWYNYPVEGISMHTLSLLLVSFLLPIIVLTLLLPAYRDIKSNKHYQKELRSIKYNPRVFNSLLNQQKSIVQSTEGLGIVIGAPDAKNKIIKVCNPYCQPCAEAHIVMERLLNNSDNVQLQIIFNISADEKDIRVPPVKHLLALNSKQDATLTRQALNDWYLPGRKNYISFAERYPLNGELDQQEAKLQAMSDWCSGNRITYTPTIFVNGYELPPNYNFNDLKYFLNP